MDKRKTLIQAFSQTVENNPMAEALLSYSMKTKSFIGETYVELYEKTLKLAAFLKEIGFRREEKAAIVSDNNPLWPVVDFAIQALGGINIAKGSDSHVEETSYIMNLCEVEKVFLEKNSLVKYFLENRDQYKTVKRIFVMYDEEVDFQSLRDSGVEGYNLSEILGKNLTEDQKKAVEDSIAQGDGDDIASIIFTSGTTGEPKGVMLSHYNTLFQVENKEEYITVHTGTRVLCVLPIWHAFQRLANYCFLIGEGGTLVYSKPIPHIMLRDIAATNPEYLVCVPRLLTAIQEGIFKNIKKSPWIFQLIFNIFFIFSRWNVLLGRRWMNKIPEFTQHNFYIFRFFAFIAWIITLPFLGIGRTLIFHSIYKRFGKKFKGFISGGGKLPRSTDRFFSILGLSIQDSYGLTETAPGIAMRKSKGSLSGTVGSAFAGMTEIELRNEDGKPVAQGEKGEIFVRGPQVMKGGYYKRPDLTAQVISPDGWFKTGDLGRISRQGDIEIVGRAKDTIVLLSGKNIEPLPLEDALRESQFIENAVVLGQDQKFLGALIVISLEEVEKQVEASKTGTLRERAKAMVSSANVEGRLKLLQNRAQELLSMPEFDLGSLKNIPRERWWETKEVNDLVASEVRHYINVKNGFKDYEMIISFKILPRSFEVDKEVSPKLEVKRHVINEIYKKEIGELFR